MPISLYTNQTCKHRVSLSLPSFNWPRPTFTSQPSWSPHFLSTKMTATAATAHTALRYDLRRGAPMREQSSKQADWRGRIRIAPKEDISLDLQPPPQNHTMFLDVRGCFLCFSGVYTCSIPKDRGCGQGPTSFIADKWKTDEKGKLGSRTL